MKILFDGRPKQFGCVRVVCADRIMIELLNSNNDCNVSQRLLDDKRSGKESFFELMFKSGAKLKVSDTRHNFYIFGYHYSGQDILEAAADLVRWEAERQARLRIEKFPK